LEHPIDFGLEIVLVNAVAPAREYADNSATIISPK